MAEPKVIENVLSDGSTVRDVEYLGYRFECEGDDIAEQLAVLLSRVIDIVPNPLKEG